MKSTDSQKQEPTRANRSNQPFFGAKSATAFFVPGQSVQRDPFFQTSNASLATPIQAKLTVGAVGDKYEQEADRVASEVVDRINAPSPQPAGEQQSVQRVGEADEELQMMRSPDAIQRLSEEEDDLQMKPMVQRVGAEGGLVAADLEGEINSARGGGQALAPKLQAQMGQAMGADFSGVRVHTDGRADQLNQLVQAKAFTTRQDLFFRQGAYEPGSRGGQELIAHELTHVAQQNRGAVVRWPLIAKPLLKNSATKHSSPTPADTVIQAQEDHYIQTKRVVSPEEAPPSEYKAFIDTDKKGETYAEYADTQYRTNRERAVKVIGLIQKSLMTSKGGAKNTNATYEMPNPEQWEVIPKIGGKIFGYGVKVEYNHKSLMFDSAKKVGYQTQFKRNAESGKIELLAAANYAPTAGQKSLNADPHLQMNLNQIWASQLDYFMQLEAADANYKQKGGSKKLHQVKRSKVENWSSLATYWITTNYGIGGSVVDVDDWLALSGSPNGNALLWLILQNPELGEELDSATIAADVTSLYTLDVDNSGPYFLFH